MTIFPFLDTYSEHPLFVGKEDLLQGPSWHSLGPTDRALTRLDNVYIDNVIFCGSGYKFDSYRLMERLIGIDKILGFVSNIRNFS